MKNITKINDLRERKAYVPARVKVINVTAQRVICQSYNGTGNQQYEDGDTSNWF